MGDVVLDSSVAIRVAIMRLADPDLPMDDRVYFLNELFRHGRLVSEYAQGQLDSINRAAMNAAGEGDDASDLRVHGPVDPLH